ncbi:MAG: glycosyltransferase [Clostridia bacterium]|nr:glycosyltransferase [Clostridia bacterium]
MRIMHILSDSNVGGAGILLENLLRHTGTPKGDICVLLPRGAAMAARYRALGVAVRDVLSMPDRSFATEDLPAVIEAIRLFCPDVVHTHASMTGRVAAWLLGIRVRVATRHCAYPVGREGKPLRRLLHRVGDRILTTCTVATAYAAQKNLHELGIPEKKTVMIRNGAEPLSRMSAEKRRAARAALGMREESFCLGMAARLARVKGQDVLLRAAARLRQSGEDVHVLLVGEGAEQENLEKLAAELGIFNAVIFAGFVADPAAYVNLFDLAVNCSRGTETSCLALSEAMSLGIPVVASDFGGNPEMVREGENGLLFPSEDEEALASAILRLLYDPSLYRRLSGGARRRFLLELDARKMAAKYDRLYTRLAEGASRFAPKRKKQAKKL